MPRISTSASERTGASLRRTVLAAAAVVLSTAGVTPALATAAHAQTPYCGTNTADNSTTGITATQNGNTVTCTYTVSGNAGGEFTFTPPSGVSQLDNITATGAPGGDLLGTGGKGGTVTATALGVTTGLPLYFEIGGAGGMANNTGGYNGGGGSDTSGSGGGGATSVQTCAAKAGSACTSLYGTTSGPAFSLPVAAGRRPSPAEAAAAAQEALAHWAVDQAAPGRLQQPGWCRWHRSHPGSAPGAGSSASPDTAGGGGAAAPPVVVAVAAPPGAAAGSPEWQWSFWGAGASGAGVA
ncbi:hypothetical protein O1M54_15270 [Streptomyces diastatochromogenes]|nr:hypothetical protein [Streptomyces diastatochromogenes]